MLKMYDFYCGKCWLEFESLVFADAEIEYCPECGEPSNKIMSSPRIGLYTNPGSDTTKNALKKRSFDHSVKEAKKNPEKVAKAYGGKPKAQTPWNIRSHKK